MPCESYRDPETGTTFLIRCSRAPQRLCKFCRKLYATKLCDAPLANGKTCDAPICPSCATSGGEDIDYCPDHRNQQSLFGGTQ